MKIYTSFSINDGDTLFCPIVDRSDDTPITSYQLDYSDDCKAKMAAANEVFEQLSKLDEETDDDFYEVEERLVHFLSYELQPTLPKEVQSDFEGTLEGAGYKEVVDWIRAVLSELTRKSGELIVKQQFSISDNGFGVDACINLYREHENGLEFVDGLCLGKQFGFPQPELLREQVELQPDADGKFRVSQGRFQFELIVDRVNEKLELVELTFDDLISQLERSLKDELETHFEDLSSDCVWYEVRDASRTAAEAQAIFKDVTTALKESVRKHFMLEGDSN